VTGLNTAATLWATAAVGALAGAWAWREAVSGALIIIAANGFLQPLAARMDRLYFKTGREIPPADYVFEVVCVAAAEAGVRRLIVQTLTRPRMQLKSLRSFHTTTPDEVRLRAELSAAARDDSIVENAVQTLSMETSVRSVRWALQNEAAADWTTHGSD
jgi:putative Mg2+ transporter-C (MgtC) family protein